MKGIIPANSSSAIPLKFRFVFSFMGALCSFCVFLAVLKAWNGPSGFDVYYYALQTRAFTETGELLFSDHSLVYGFLFLINCIVKNPILTTQIVSALSVSVIYTCLLLISFRGGFSVYKTAAASIAVFNPAVFYLLLEFTKNSFALALFFLAYLLSSGNDGGIRFSFKNTFFTLRPILGFAFFILTFFSHRIMIALIFMLIVHHAAAYLLPRIKQQYRKRIIVIVSICIGICLITALSTAWNKFSGRLPKVNIAEPYHRIIQLSTNQLMSGERIFYLLIQITLFFLIPFTLIKHKQFFKPDVVFACMGWLFIFPFFSFSWDETGFRLLILTPIIIAPWLMNLKLPSVTAAAAAAVFAAGCILFSIESIQNLAVLKGPDYQSYEKEFENIQELARGRRVIAHRGLAGFLWYEKGIRSENFTPRTEQDSYLRIVFAFAPEILNDYLEEGDPHPIALNRRYTLVEEYVWQRFYRDRHDLYFLKSELNPYLPRPESGFVINRETAELLSPVSIGSL